MEIYNEIIAARQRLQGVVEQTPCTQNLNLSEVYGARIFLKREDLQLVRSYKIRGAYNKISTLNNESKELNLMVQKDNRNTMTQTSDVKAIR
jgi:threonine dehydratase